MAEEGIELEKRTFAAEELLKSRRLLEEALVEELRMYYWIAASPKYRPLMQALHLLGLTPLTLADLT